MIPSTSYRIDCVVAFHMQLQLVVSYPSPFDRRAFWVHNYLCFQFNVHNLLTFHIISVSVRDLVNAFGTCFLQNGVILFIDKLVNKISVQYSNCLVGADTSIPSIEEGAQIARRALDVLM